jgi:hypothetical protein
MEPTVTYRIEHHDPQLPPLVVGYAESVVSAQKQADDLAAAMRSRRGWGELVTIDQRTEEIVTRTAV